MKYRPEIDGLRAIAVIPVTLFHGNIPGFQGGFVGVDVFFVISGFLITNILVERHADGKEGLSSFYIRRVRRLGPALFVMLLACAVAAWFVLLPEDLDDFSNSLLSVLGLASNFYFWQTADYFSPSGELRLLLHTWSLAVEEQFYLIYPLAFLALWRMGRTPTLVLLTVGALLSLALAQWGAFNRPAATFYLLPTRAWELMIGAVLALLPDGRQRSGVYADLVSFCGLALIFYAIAFFNDTTPFPGLWGLLPTVGAAFVIRYAYAGTVAGALLRNQSLVWIGLVSYSFYLWHQPVLAFSRHIKGSWLSIPEALALLLLSLGLAGISYAFVERPARVFSQGRHAIRFRLIVTSLISASVLLAVFAVVALVLDVSSIRLDATTRMFLASKQQNAAYMKEGAFGRFGCFLDQTQQIGDMAEHRCLERTDGITVVLFGDSEAAHYLPGLSKVPDATGLSTQQLTSAGCRPIRYEGQASRCAEFYDAFFTLVAGATKPGDIVVVAGNWWNTFEQLGEEGFAAALTETLVALGRIGLRPVVVGNTPEFLSDPYVAALKGRVHQNSTIYLAVEDYWTSNRSLERTAAQLGVSYADPARFLCLEKECRFREDEQFLFFDSGHLSEWGSEIVVREVLWPAILSQLR